MSKVYNQGKLKPLIKIIVRMLSKSPSLIMNIDNLMARVEEEIPELKNKTHCANCGASMVQYEYNVDVINTTLVIGMAAELKKRIAAGKQFTQANIIHVPTLPISNAARCRTTRCKKLGLIAKYNGEKSKGKWVITKRGFAALKGEAIPTGIIVWRGETIERAEKNTTFAQVKKDYITKITNYIEKHNEQPKGGTSAEVMNYESNEWVQFAGTHEGKLF